MAQLVVYFSLSGKSKALAQAFAKENGCDIKEVVPQKKISKLKAFLLCPKAISGGGVPVNTTAADFAAYSLVHVFAPIWSGFPAPPINTALEQLAQGTEITLTFVSSSGESSKAFKIRGDLKIRSVRNVKGA